MNEPLYHYLCEGGQRSMEQTPPSVAQGISNRNEEYCMEPLMPSTTLIRILAIGAAGSYCAAGISHFLMPPDQIHFAKGLSAEFFTSLRVTSFWFRVHYWSFVTASLCGMAIVQVLSHQLNLTSYAAQLMTLLATVGFVVTAIDFAMMQAKALQLAQGFSAFLPEVQQAAIAAELPRLDQTGLFGFGFVGLWLATVNVIMFQTGNYPAGLVILGFLSAGLLELGFIGSLLHAARLIDVAIGIGGALAGPAWFVWIAFV
jgi:hypothetical protein